MANGTFDREYLMPSEVARLFRVDPKTITRWAKEGKLPSHTLTLGGHRRYPAEEIRKLLASLIEKRIEDTR